MKVLLKSTCSDVVMIYCGHFNRYRRSFETLEGCFLFSEAEFVSVSFACLFFFYLDPISEIAVYLIYFIAFTLSHANTK